MMKRWNIDLFDPVTLFSPFLLVYLFLWTADASVPIGVIGVRFLYLGVAAVVAIPALRRAVSDPPAAAFWAALLALLIAPGAYLEYPADPWEHLRRITAWGGAARVNEYYPAHKSFYFLAWSLIGWVPIEDRRIALAVLSALTQLLICSQVYRLSRILGMARDVACLQVVAFLCLFGTSVFSFRYYALSSTSVAYAAYLAALGSLIELSRRETPNRAWCALHAALAGVVIAFNHLQELLLLGLSAGAIALAALIPWAAQRRISWVKVIVAISALSVLCGAAAVHFTPWLFGRGGLTGVSTIGTFEFWTERARIFSTLGIYGIAGLLAALILCRSMPLLALLTINPVLWLVVPPLFVVIHNLVPDPGNVYRLLYAMPSSFMLTAGLLALVERRAPLRSLAGRRVVLCGALICILGMASRPPLYGRLRFQIYTPDPMLSLEPLDQTAAWFHRHRSLPDDCYVYTDGMTSFALNAQLGTDPWVYRLVPWRLVSLSAEEMVQATRREGVRPACGILVADKSKLPPARPSWVPYQSRHWAPHLGDLAWYVDDVFVKEAKRLEGLGWRATSVPPFYTYYEP